MRAFLVLLSVFAGLRAHAQLSSTIVMREGFAVGGVTRGGRVPVPIDLIQFQRARNGFRVPIEGLAVQSPTAVSPLWEAIKAGPDDKFQGDSLVGGYLFTEVELADAGTYILEAAGHGMVYVNDVARAGDVYSYGYLKLPVDLKKGKNAFLFAVARGALSARLVPAPKDAYLDLGDPTLPDLMVGDKAEHWGAVVVINTTREDQKNLVLTTGTGSFEMINKLGAIPAMSIRKVPFKFKLDTARAGALPLILKLSSGAQALPAIINVVTSTATHKETFLSQIDGSVQYYSVVPAQKTSPSNALILSLHGASVEATSQAAAYQAKDWATIVCPTNRRPFGFDWEEIGRKDAMEVWALAKKTYAYNARRTIVTGHSMGGHGTWHIGLSYPGEFAAIGPSAGWASFFSYAGSPKTLGDDPVAQIMERAMNPSETKELVRNALGQRVYILHGDKDDNVPVSEGRAMRELLKFHPDLTYHEQPGAGHWWGNECMDWPAMFDVFKTARLPVEEGDRAIFLTTANPTINGSREGITIEQLGVPMSFGSITAECKNGHWTITTDNVQVMTLDLPRLNSDSASILVDQSEITVLPRQKPITLENKNDKWVVRKAPTGIEKRAGFSGPFKDVLDKRFVFVVGTIGNEWENAWALETAKYHAETFIMRGNGTVDIVLDKDFKPADFLGRNVILFGNHDGNKAWGQVLKSSPIDIRRESVKVGKHEVKGTELACLFIQPRKDSPGNLVGVIAGTGLAGNRMAERLLIWTSGVAFPDWVVIGAEGLALGTVGVRGAGFFGPMWDLTGGDSAWRPERKPD